MMRVRFYAGKRVRTIEVKDDNAEAWRAVRSALDEKDISYDEKVSFSGAKRLRRLKCRACGETQKVVTSIVAGAEPIFCERCGERMSVASSPLVYTR